jgi:hypothetical protein
MLVSSIIFSNILRNVAIFSEKLKKNYIFPRAPARRWPAISQCRRPRTGAAAERAASGARRPASREAAAARRPAAQSSTRDHGWRRPRLAAGEVGVGGGTGEAPRGAARRLHRVATGSRGGGVGRERVRVRGGIRWL